MSAPLMVDLLFAGKAAENLRTRAAAIGLSVEEVLIDLAENMPALPHSQNGHLVCVSCGAPFRATRAGQFYCADEACKREASRSRQARYRARSHP